MCCRRHVTCSRESAPIAAERRRQGFSLIELMVVIVLIGLLAGVVTINVRGYMTRGRQEAARSEVATISMAVESFYTLTGRYPSNEEGIAFLARTSDVLPEPLLKQVPRDPWGRPYQYASPGRSAPYEVVCLGADGREGGTGADADVVSWDLKAASGGSKP